MSAPQHCGTNPLKRRWLIQRFLLGASAIAIAATGPATQAGSTPQAKDDPHWDYEGDNGPEEWGSLDEDYALCSTGDAQSPIDIAQASPADLVDVIIDYATISPMKIINTGHTVQVNIEPGSTLKIDGSVYELKQFHFHTPSEHAIDGQRQAMEFHLVHQNANEELAVLSVLLRQGAANADLDPVFANMPTEEGPEQTMEVEIDPSSFLPEVRTTFRYAGSLTTPPCSEGVHWLLFVEPVEISAEQIAVFRTIYEQNARPLQPTNDREIDQDSTI